MSKFSVIAVFFLFLVNGPAFLQAEGTAPSAVPPAPAVAVALPYETLWAKAKDFQAQDRLLEAQAQYEAALQESNIPAEKQKQIQKEYENLNFKIIFSSVLFPGSESYEVVPGDSLYRIAKKKGTTVELIKKINQLRSDTIFAGKKFKLITGEFKIRVDKSDNTLVLYLDDKPVKTYRVATGADNNTPVGEFKIINKLVDPTWYYEGAVIPFGSPENILGTRWMGFDLESYGIHGTTLPETIGTQASLGCIRMLNAEVEELYDMLPLGVQVKVQD